MKEIIALDEKIVALPEGKLPEEGIDVSRHERSDAIETLPEDIRAEIDALQRALNEAIPEPFDYFVFLGGDEEASFSIQFNHMPAVNDFDTERSIVEQVRELDWEQQKARAVEQHGRMSEVMDLLGRLGGPLPSAKKWQREFREDIKDFVKDKRRDAGKIHALAWDEEEGLLESEFPDGDAFREALPGTILRGEEVLSVVAFGKPLPVERIDALKAEAQQRARERVKQAREAEAGGAAVPEIEAEVVSENRAPARDRRFVDNGTEFITITPPPET